MPPLPEQSKNGRKKARQRKNRKAKAKKLKHDTPESKHDTKELESEEPVLDEAKEQPRTDETMDDFIDSLYEDDDPLELRWKVLRTYNTDKITRLRDSKLVIPEAAVEESSAFRATAASMTAAKQKLLRGVTQLDKAAQMDRYIDELLTSL